MSDSETPDSGSPRRWFPKAPRRLWTWLQTWLKTWLQTRLRTRLRTWARVWRSIWARSLDRLRTRFWPTLRRGSLLLSAACLLLAGLLTALYFWASSAAFEDAVRHRVIAALNQATGGRTEIGAFHWDLLHLSFEAQNVTVHGLESAAEAPYAHVGRLRAQIAISGLAHWAANWGSPARILLREAEIDQPEFHLIVYPDGTTNQPHPRHPRKPGKPALDTLFDARIGRLSVERGSAHIANLIVPLDLQARDASLQLSWHPGPGNGPSTDPGSYRIALGVGQLDFEQGGLRPIPSRLDASLALGRDSLQVDSMQLSALGRLLTLRGQLSGFAHPVWQAQADGQVDLRLVAPYARFLYTLGGVVDLNAALTGHGTEFSATGGLASNAIHYQDPVVDAHTAAFSARFRCDSRQLLVSPVRIRVAQGGAVEGEFQFDNWLHNTPAPPIAQALLREHKTWLKPTGAVRGALHGVSLDTILAMLAIPQYRHLGLDTQVSGPATAAWTGFADDLVIDGQLALEPSAQAASGEVPVQGSVDATYRKETGSVQVRTLDAHLPHSLVQGAGSLGVYPAGRASEMDLDLKSSDLADFDGVLRALDLRQGGRVGSSALPVSLAGQAEFHGQLNSSWQTPRVEGHLTATRLAIPIPLGFPSSSPGAPTQPTQPAQPAQAAQTPGPPALTWDSVDVDGLYTPASIVIRRATLHRGPSTLTVQGRLDSSDPTYKLGDTAPEFGPHSTLSLKASAQQFPLADLLPIAGIAAPLGGAFSSQVDVKGQLGNLTGSGTVDLARATFYGEAVERLHAEGAVAGQQLRIVSLTAQQTPGQSGGRLTGSGSCDFAHRSFQLDLRASGIDLSRLEALKRAGIQVTGKAALTAAGAGTFADPHLQTRATFSGMTVAGEPVADLLVSASTAQHAVAYDLSSRQPAGEFAAHGLTQFNPQFDTQASLQFSKFDVGAMLKLLRVTGITGQSALEGTANISGPLAGPGKLRGEASLNAFTVAIEGVHLASKGAVHATLVEGVARLDPLEITGEDTDLKVDGSLDLAGKRQLDLKARGSVNLRLAETLDPDLIASGVTSFEMEAHGPLAAPILQGKVEFQNAALALQDFPNGLSQIQGALEFIQNRLEVRSLTAMSGGGQLSVGGYLGFQRGLYADLTATGKSIRIRYPEGISSLADAKLRLQGPQNNLLLSGNVEVTRFVINSDLDLTAITAQASAVQPIVSPDSPSNHLRLDVNLTSAPQLNFQNAYAKLAGDVDLHLLGTLASPSLLGRISLTEGHTSIGGTQYELQRGDILFNNPVRIQPNIDLEATARVEDYDITLGLHGTPDKLNVTYRSEPPLPEADVIALLALGRTESEQSAYAGQQQQAGGNPMTDALLGGALNATVSNRVQRLFGTGAIKIDPNFIGSLGNSTARVTVVEQIGKNLTFTYASNVNTTTQQLIQAEIAINRHVSLLVTQDESGIFSVVVKARRRWR